MKNAVKSLFIFAAGAAIGAVATWKVLGVRYEQRYQRDVQSTKEAYENLSRRVEPINPDDQPGSVEEELPDIREYAARLKEEEYFDYSSVPEEPEEPKEIIDRPYVISPEEFGEFEDYEKIELVYYADDKLADDRCELVDDVDELVGEESLTHFGEYENDAVHVRNDAKKCDYEILRDSDTYFDAIKTKPYRDVGV